MEEPAAAEMDNGAEMRWARSLVANQAKSEKSARKGRLRGQGGRFVKKQPAPLPYVPLLSSNFD